MAFGGNGGNAGTPAKKNLSENVIFRGPIAKDCLLTLVKSRLALGSPGCSFVWLFVTRVAEVAREHGWHPPKSLDSDENFKPEHTLFCRELRFVAIYALFWAEKIFFGSTAVFFCS